MYLNLHLSHLLRVPKPLLAHAQQSKSKQRKQNEIIIIEHWVVCFNAYISVTAVKFPHQVCDLLSNSYIVTSGT